MYGTIQIASCVLVQGEFVEMLADGRVVIRDGQTEYRGHPVGRRCKPAALARLSGSVAAPSA